MRRSLIVASSKLVPLVMLASLAVPARAQAPRDASPLPALRCGFGDELVRARTTHAKGVRPASNAEIASTTLPIVLHYKDGVAPEYAAEILALTEATWRREVDELGFLAPRSDGEEGGDGRFDVYIVTDLDPGIGGYAGFSGYDETTPRQDAVGYLVINNALDPRLRSFVVAHEFFHASQMAYDWWESLSFMEASATWIADHAFDDSDIYWRYFPFFNAEPFRTLSYVSIKNPFQYGSALFYQFLDEWGGNHDASIVRRMWEGSVQDVIDNEPDFLDALARLLPPGTSVGEAYEEFGVWRLLTGTRKRFTRFREGATWDDRLDPLLEADVAADVATASGEAKNALQPLGNAYLRFARPAGESARYAVTIKRPAGTGAARIGVRWLALGEAGYEEGRVGALDDAGALHVEIAPTRADLREVVVVLTNETDGTFDPDTSPMTGVPYGWDFEVLAR
jgi:hypothetical protein